MKLRNIVKIGCMALLVLVGSVTVTRQPLAILASAGMTSWYVADDVKTVPVVMQNAEGNTATSTQMTTKTSSTTASTTKKPTTSQTVKPTVVKHVSDQKVSEVGTDFKNIDKDTLSGMFNDPSSGKTTPTTTTTQKPSTTGGTTTTTTPPPPTKPEGDSRLRAGKIPESQYLGHIQIMNATTGKVYDGSTRESLQKAIAFDVKIEMGTSLFAEKSDEAWKAQAVASYTYLLRYCWYGSTYSFGSESDPNSVPDLNLNNPTDKRIYDAVGQVLGVKLLDTTKSDPFKSLCLTTYYASSAGVSSDSGKVWVTQLPYLKSVASPYETDANIQHFTGGYMGLTSKYETTFSAVMNTLKKKYGATICADTKEGQPCIYATEWDGGVGKYVAKTNLYYYTDSGVKTYITGDSFRAAIGLRSHAFTVTQNGDNITFTVLGYGHGVGLSQMGAVCYANIAGWDYIQILQHYYSVTGSSSQQLVAPLW